MAQFTIYRSSDTGAPVLNGLSGSMVNVLNQILVTGYGSKAAAGWTADFTGSATSSSMFRPASGSRMSLSVRDDGLVTTREARVIGWEIATTSLTGSGPFPSAGQTSVNLTGYLVVRKSATIDATARTWVAFADASTMYFAGLTENSGVYYFWFFGDIYSVKSGSTDDYKCIIAARTAENQATANTNASLTDIFSSINAAVGGHWMARTWTGQGTSIAVGKHGDGACSSGGTALGTLLYPNSHDNALYLSPIWVHESATNTIRGRMRGLWMIPHPVASFTDGQLIVGTGPHTGKTFYVLKGTENAGMLAFETSNTLETNA